MIALYPGSFDPATIGHLDVIKRASLITDKLLVAVLHNANKETAFTLDERVEMLKRLTRALKNVEVISFSGLLVDFMKETDCKVALRGLRVATDLEYEFQLSTTNNILDPSIDTVFLMPNPKYNFLTSSIVREAYMLGGQLEGCVPPPVHAALLKKFGGRGGRGKNLNKE
jgi:pantetheine-phosphate adenylyltransferase